LDEMLTQNLNIELVRVDNRLVHGQILESWVPHVKAQCIIVADDAIAGDVFNKTVIRMAVPSEIELIINTIEDFVHNFVFERNSGKNTIVLFSSIKDVCKAFALGFHFDKLNIGNIHHEDFKVCCSPSVFLCDTEIDDILKLLENSGVAVELKRVPQEKAINIKEALKNYCKNST